MPENEILIGYIKGETGSGLKVLDYFDTLEALTAAITNPSPGDAYGVGTAAPYQIYIYSANKGWVNNGALQPDINEQTPIYTETEFAPLTSGEKISVAFGKISKAIKQIMYHAGNMQNPHQVTLDQVGGAPSGHGLGGLCTPKQHIPFKDVMHDGCGFYQVACDEDSPNSLSGWMDLLQLVRNANDGAENGAQIAFNDYESTPYMWIRTLIRGYSTNWVEMLHTGNSSKIKKGSYVGGGAYSLVGEHYKTIPVDFAPKLMIISRRDNTEYAETNIIPFYANDGVGKYCYVKVGDEHTYARSLFSYNSTDKVIKIYNKSGIIYRDKVDLSTGYMLPREQYDFKNTPNEKLYASGSLLDFEFETYDYIIIG